MENQKHLDILIRGKEVWNQWREDHGGESQPDLSGAKLSSFPLFETNLIYANLRGADLSGASLDFADLQEANLPRDAQRA